MLPLHHIGEMYDEVKNWIQNKNNEKDFKIPLIYYLEGTDRALAKGSFVFKRTDFEIGTGIWSNTLILKDDVTVNVSLILDLLR